MNRATKRSRLTVLICCAAFCAALNGEGQIPSDSLQHLKDAAQREPNSPEAQNALGEALDESGDLQSARDAFVRALKLKPAYAQAYVNLGLVSLQMNNPEAAALNLDRAIELFRKNAGAGFAWYLRAKIYTMHSESEKALRALNQAVVLRPDLAEAWSDLGIARKAALDDSGALAAFKRAVELKPDDAVAQYRLGSEYLREDKPHLAVEHLDLAYRGNSTDQSTLNSLQTALRRDGKPAEADRIRQELTSLLREKDQASQNAVTAVKINNEGASLQKSGDLQAALEKYSQALKLYPEHVGIRVNYAVALLRLGHWTQGLEELHEALRRDPGNSQIKAALDDALAQAPPGSVPQWGDDRRQ